MKDAFKVIGHHLKSGSADAVAGLKDAWRLWRDQLYAGNAWTWLEFIGWLMMLSVGIAWLLLKL